MKRRAARFAMSFIGVLLLAAIAAPYIKAGRFTHLIKDGLEHSLQRKVRIRDARFSLWRGPAFSIENVLIEEDASAGIEPFAHVSLLEARLSLLSLLVGRIEFSYLRLVEPRVNLVKPESGQWNVAPLLARGTAGKSFPTIEVEDGRINLKLGDTKSPFYITNADLVIAPRSGEPGSFDVRFSGEPARTDRTAQGFGVLACRGKWSTAGSSEPKLDLFLELEKSSIVEISQLIRGRDYGLHGLVASQAQISGPISELNISGQLSVEDVHRWDLMPGRTGNGWRLKYEGKGNVRDQRIELTAGAKQNPGLPLTLRLRLSDWLYHPRLAGDVTMLEFPASAMTEIAGHLGAALPASFKLDGRISGVLGYSSTGGAQGQAQITGITAGLPDSSQYKAAHADLSLSGWDVRLDPVLVQSANGRSAILEAAYSGALNELKVDVKAHLMDLDETRSLTGQIIGASSLPLFEHLSGGVWSGGLVYRRSETEQRWTGEFTLRNSQARVPGLADPVRVASAAVQLDQDRVQINRLKARAGTLDIEGDYRYEPEDRRPHRLRLLIPSAELAQLTRLLAPSLRREQGFLARTLRRDVAIPDWLKERRAAGSLRIGVLTAEGGEWRDVRASFTQDGTEVTLTNVQAKLGEEGAATGTGTLLLGGASPRFKLNGRVQNMEWKEGRLDLEGSWETAGVGADFIANLRSSGTFQARAIAVLPDAQVRSVTGEYELEMGRGGPRIKLMSLEAALGAEKYLGKGATQEDGRLMIDLASATRAMRVAGSILPLKLDYVAARP